MLYALNFFYFFLYLCKIVTCKVFFFLLLKMYLKSLAKRKEILYFIIMSLHFLYSKVQSAFCVTSAISASYSSIHVYCIGLSLSKHIQNQKKKKKE